MFYILLDVDNTLAPCSNDMVVEMGQGRATQVEEWRGIPVIVSNSVARRLAELSHRPGVVVHWCTTWNSLALGIGERLGLNQDGYLGGVVNQRSKTAQIVAFASSHPDDCIVVVDDGFVTWPSNGDKLVKPANVILVPPTRPYSGEACGLCFDDLDRVERLITQPLQRLHTPMG